MSTDAPMAQNNVESSDSVTAAEYINSQLELEQAAREVLPYSFDKCTYAMGPMRQPIYSCLDHNSAAICYGCSISCHSECNLVEIFGKRNIVCDCGTTKMPGFTCDVRKSKDDKHAETNHYCHNYEGRFCACDLQYEPEKEKGTMYQCLLGDVCNEDWFHDTCIMGLGALKYDEQKPEEEKKEGEAEAEEEEEDKPSIPGFPSEDDFEHFICWQCVEKNSWLKRYAGAEGFLPGVIRKEENSNETAPQALEPAAGAVSRGEKRKADDDGDEDMASPKRQRASPEGDVEMATSTTTTAVTTSEQTITTANGETETASTVTTTEATTTSSATVSEAAPCKLPPLTISEHAKVSLFLLAPFRSHLCRCPSCFPLLAQHKILLEEEETYSPPMSEAGASEDGNSSSRSLLERGEKALSALDRVKAIEGVMAYNLMKDKVKTFLRPFAEEGRQVSAEDVRKYFEALRGDNQPAAS